MSTPRQRSDARREDRRPLLQRAMRAEAKYSDARAFIQSIAALDNDKPAHWHDPWLAQLAREWLKENP